MGIKKFGSDSFKKVLSESRTGFEYNLEKVISVHNIALPEEKIKASAEICALIAAVPAQVQRDIYIRIAAQRLDVSADALKYDVERAARKLVAERKQKESTEAQLSLKNIGDRVNVEAAKHIRATANEEILLGLMLMFEEFRREAASGNAGVTADDFVTSFSRRVFEVICELENSEAGFSKAMLGQHFNVDEIGRIEKLEVGRKDLAKNDKEVFLSCIQGLKQEKIKLAQTDDPFDDLRRKQAALKDKKNKTK